MQRHSPEISSYAAGLDQSIQPEMFVNDPFQISDQAWPPPKKSPLIVL